MSTALAGPALTDRDKRSVADTVAAQAPRLRAFVRRQVDDIADVDDIVQETFAELVAAFSPLRPIENVAGWLLRVARNRIIDRFRARSRRAVISQHAAAIDPEPESARVLDGWLAAPGDGPEGSYARAVLAEEIAAALDELPSEQRDAFVAHEIEGRSFRELAEASGLSINTLLGRKHAAVQYLRKRLHALFEDLDT